MLSWINCEKEFWFRKGGSWGAQCDGDKSWFQDIPLRYWSSGAWHKTFDVYCVRYVLYLFYLFIFLFFLFFVFFCIFIFFCDL